MARHLLGWGVALPAIYFGIQLVAAPFFPDYSFFARDASSLGSPFSTAPWIFNWGMLLLSIVEVSVAGAFLIALPRMGVGRSLAATTALGMASAGLGSVNAFLHPLPDPRHVEGLLALLGSGFMLLPALAAIVLWRLGARGAGIATTVTCLMLIPVMTGLTQRACIALRFECAGYQLFLNGYHGLIQRIGAGVVFAPVGVIAYLARRRLSPAPHTTWTS
jgi:hypothetical protein